MALFARNVARALPELAAVHGHLCPSAFALPLGLAGQTSHVFFAVPTSASPSLKHSLGQRPCWMEPLRAQCEFTLPIHHPCLLNAEHSQPATSSVTFWG